MKIAGFLKAKAVVFLFATKMPRSEMIEDFKANQSSSYNVGWRKE